MNDFTKEELIIILGAFEWIDADPAYRAPGGWNKPLQTKIQSMIDNYKCKHKRCSPVEALNMPLHCLDCGENFE